MDSSVESLNLMRTDTFRKFSRAAGTALGRLAVSLVRDRDRQGTLTNYPRDGDDDMIARLEVARADCRVFVAVPPGFVKQLLGRVMRMR